MGGSLKVGFGTEISIIMAYAFGLVLLYVIGYILLVPIKIILKLIMNGIIGGIVLLIINFAGSFINLFIPINPITALITGFLGIPGILMILFLREVLF